MALVTVNRLDSVGIIKDINPESMPPEAWTAGQNIRFRNGAVERIDGHRRVFGSPQVSPKFVRYFPPSADPHWLYTDGRKVFVAKGTSHFDITREDGEYHGTDINKWDAFVFNGVGILNNGVDPPQQWSPISKDTRLINLENWPAAEFVVETMRPFKSFLVVMNVTSMTKNINAPFRFAWGQPATPGNVPLSWDIADPATQAGEIDIAETPGKLVDGLTLGDVFIIYKEFSTWGARFVGGQAIFAFGRILDSQGILTKNCVSAISGGHFVVTQNDIIVHNGQRNSDQSILTSRLGRWLFNNIDEENFHKAFTIPVGGEVWFCFPTSGSTECNLALIWNKSTGAIGFRDLPLVRHGSVGPFIASPDASISETWDQDADSWASTTDIWDTAATLSSKSLSNPIFASPVGSSLILANDGISFDGAVYTTSIERTGLTIVGSSRTGDPVLDPQTIKFIRWFWPIIEGQVGDILTIKLGGQKNLNQPVVWQRTRTYVIGVSVKVPAFFNTRFLAISIESSSGSPWKLSGYKLDLDGLGVY